MTDDVRDNWASLREMLISEHVPSKDAQAVSVELARRFAMLDAGDRPAVEDLLCRWVNSDDEALRFDALYVISENSLVSAQPALWQLATTLDADPTPSARFEREKVIRLIERLAAAS